MVSQLFSGLLIGGRSRFWGSGRKKRAASLCGDTWPVGILRYALKITCAKTGNQGGGGAHAVRRRPRHWRVIKSAEDERELLLHLQRVDGKDSEGWSA